MDLRKVFDWSPPNDWRRISVVDSHTGGEPFRVVVDGVPEIPGATVLARRNYAVSHLDWLRKALMWEPRGHADMYGCFVTPPVEEDSEMAVLFIHNEGFSTMCGHGIIALVKVAIDTGLITWVDDAQTIGIDTPAGQVRARASMRDGVVDEVSFENVPSFAVSLGSTVQVPDLGTVRYDLAFGGAFYAYVAAESVGLALDDVSTLIEKGRSIKKSIIGSQRLEHPFQPDLGFLYGVIFVGEPKDTSNHSRNVCIFADGELDRSPTGTGVSGRLALEHARGDLEVGDSIAVESITGSIFRGRVAGEVNFGPYHAVVPEISGNAHILGRSEFWFDPDDQLGEGFLLR